MRRRQVIALGLAAAACPLPARAQSGRLRRVGIIYPLVEDDPETRARLAALRARLAELGWAEGRDLQIDVRTGVDDAGRMKSAATALVAARSDVIMTINSATTQAVRDETREIPVVFMAIADPVGRGFAASLARPGGPSTGFTNADASMGGKWLQLLREVAPDVRRVGVIANPLQGFNPREGYFAAIESAARQAGIEVVTATLVEPDGIDRFLDGEGGSAGGGLIVLPGLFTFVHRTRIIAAAARNKLAAIYPYRAYAVSGGLMYYGLDFVDLHRQAATYVDRILRGAKPGDLPVQTPVKFELIVNLRAARALGLAAPDSLLVQADEVIE